MIILVESHCPGQTDFKAFLSLLRVTFATASTNFYRTKVYGYGSTICIQLVEPKHLVTGRERTFLLRWKAVHQNKFHPFSLSLAKDLSKMTFLFWYDFSQGKRLAFLVIDCWDKTYQHKFPSNTIKKINIFSRFGMRLS